jgi:hypothetical protein
MDGLWLCEAKLGGKMETMSDRDRFESVENTGTDIIRDL